MTTSDYCPSCGSKLHGDESVCPFCGYRLAEFRESLHSGEPDGGKTHADATETLVAETGFKPVEVEVKREKRMGSGKHKIFILALLIVLLIAALLGYLHFKQTIRNGSQLSNKLSNCPSCICMKAGLIMKIPCLKMYIVSVTR